MAMQDNVLLLKCSSEGLCRNAWKKLALSFFTISCSEVQGRQEKVEPAKIATKYHRTKGEKSWFCPRFPKIPRFPNYQLKTPALYKKSWNLWKNWPGQGFQPFPLWNWWKKLGWANSFLNFHDFQTISRRRKVCLKTLNPKP